MRQIRLVTVNDDDDDDDNGNDNDNHNDRDVVVVVGLQRFWPSNLRGDFDEISRVTPSHPPLHLVQATSSGRKAFARRDKKKTELENRY